MKKFLIIAIASIFAIGCNNDKTASSETSDSTSVSSEKIEYAYLPEKHAPDNWEPGDQKNIAMVLKSLKAYETGNVEEALAAFADSVWWSSDGFDAKISKDSLRSMFNQGWKNTENIKIVMHDYEAVISKDKKDEWVTLWYKQIITDKKGKIDSVECADDVKIEHGKITVLDEKTRKFPAKK